MQPVIGWGLDGACHRSSPAKGAWLGEPCWGPIALLRDLELRLGLPQFEAAGSERVPMWARRIEALLPSQPFYARSFAVDRLGTAAATLSLRDGLVEAGWNGILVPNGGARLAAIAALETDVAGSVLPGRVDRLAAVLATLRAAPNKLYEAIALVEARVLWPRLWQRIFDELELLGTHIAIVPPTVAEADVNSDLGLLQSLLRGNAPAGAARGDGSVLLLRGDTPAELAELTAALIRNSGPNTVVVRAMDAAPLEAALARQGCSTQGLLSQSAWRPAMQVLPLAIELGFEPRDPYRVLELLTLPLGPFSGVLGSRLARAVSRQPGIGGAEWRRQKEEAANQLRNWKHRAALDGGATEADATREAQAYAAARLLQLQEWVEAPAFRDGRAPRLQLLNLGERVRAWMQKRLAGQDADLYGAAYAQTQAFLVALAHDTREILTQEEARNLLDQLARGVHGHKLWPEEAGRIAHVNAPSALLAPADTVLVWGFIARPDRPALPPWNASERAALASTGVFFPEPGLLLRSQADAWRRTVLAARQRVVYVVPGTVQAQQQSPHPLWDEIRARLQLDEGGVARLTRRARSVLEERESLVATQRLPSLSLPEPLGAWKVPPELLVANPELPLSATSLETLVSCPLAWALGQRARVHAGAIARVASGPQLFGNLAHRLIELLHASEAFTSDLETFLAKARTTFDLLLEQEGATLLLPGAASERAQLTGQVVRAAREFHRYLSRSGFSLVQVEQSIAVETAVGPVGGRIDLRLADNAANPVVLDLKWGKSSYKQRLEQGRAVQLAVYARALGTKEADVPAGYFALSTGEVLAVDPRMKPLQPLQGPALPETLTRVEATAGAVTARLAMGEILVSATSGAKPLLEALGLSEDQRSQHFVSEPEEACKYCSYDVVCGRRWEVTP